MKIQSIETENLKLMPYRTVDDDYITKLHSNWKHSIFDDFEINSLNNFNNRIKQAIDTDTLGWVCWEKKIPVRIGIVYFTNIIPQISALFHPVCDIAGYKIYLKNNNGRIHSRIMDEACLAGIKYIFKNLNLQRITGAYHSDNRAMLNLCKRLGFKQEGVIRKGTRLDNSPIDIITFGLLKEEIRWI